MVGLRFSVCAGLFVLLLSVAGYGADVGGAVRSEIDGRADFDYDGWRSCIPTVCSRGIRRSRIMRLMMVLDCYCIRCLNLRSLRWR